MNRSIRNTVRVALFAAVVSTAICSAQDSPWRWPWDRRNRPSFDDNAVVAESDQPEDWTKPDTLWVAVFLQHGGSYGTQAQIDDFSKAFSDKYKGVMEGLLAETAPELEYEISAKNAAASDVIYGQQITKSGWKMHLYDHAIRRIQNPAEDGHFRLPPRIHRVRAPGRTDADVLVFSPAKGNSSGCLVFFREGSEFSASSKRRIRIGNYQVPQERIGMFKREGKDYVSASGFPAFSLTNEIVLQPELEAKTEDILKQPIVPEPELDINGDQKGEDQAATEDDEDVPETITRRRFRFWYDRLQGSAPDSDLNFDLDELNVSYRHAGKEEPETHKLTSPYVYYTCHDGVDRSPLRKFFEDHKLVLKDFLLLQVKGQIKPYKLLFLAPLSWQRKELPGAMTVEPNQFFARLMKRFGNYMRINFGPIFNRRLRSQLEQDATSRERALEWADLEVPATQWGLRTVDLKDPSSGLNGWAGNYDLPEMQLAAASYDPLLCDLDDFSSPVLLRIGFKYFSPGDYNISYNYPEPEPDTLALPFNPKRVLIRVHAADGASDEFPGNPDSPTFNDIPLPGIPTLHRVVVREEDNDIVLATFFTYMTHEYEEGDEYNLTYEVNLMESQRVPLAHTMKGDLHIWRARLSQKFVRRLNSYDSGFALSRNGSRLPSVPRRWLRVRMDSQFTDEQMKENTMLFYIKDPPSVFSPKRYFTQWKLDRAFVDRAKVKRDSIGWYTDIPNVFNEPKGDRLRQNLSLYCVQPSGLEAEDSIVGVWVGTQGEWQVEEGVLDDALPIRSFLEYARQEREAAAPEKADVGGKKRFPIVVHVAPDLYNPRHLRDISEDPNEAVNDLVEDSLALLIGDDSQRNWLFRLVAFLQGRSLIRPLQSEATQAEIDAVMNQFPLDLLYRNVKFNSREGDLQGKPLLLNNSSFEYGPKDSHSPGFYYELAQSDEGNTLKLHNYVLAHRSGNTNAILWKRSPTGRREEIGYSGQAHPYDIYQKRQFFSSDLSRSLPPEFNMAERNIGMLDFFVDWVPQQVNSNRSLQKANEQLNQVLRRLYPMQEQLEYLQQKHLNRKVMLSMKPELFSLASASVVIRRESQDVMIEREPSVGKVSSGVTWTGAFRSEDYVFYETESGSYYRGRAGEPGLTEVEELPEQSTRMFLGVGNTPGDFRGYEEMLGPDRAEDPYFTFVTEEVRERWFQGLKRQGVRGNYPFALDIPAVPGKVVYAIEIPPTQLEDVKAVYYHGYYYTLIFDDAPPIHMDVRGNVIDEQTARRGMAEVTRQFSEDDAYQARILLIGKYEKLRKKIAREEEFRGFLNELDARLRDKEKVYCWFLSYDYNARPLLQSERNRLLETRFMEDTARPK